MKQQVLRTWETAKTSSSKCSNRFFFLFLKRCSISQVDPGYQPDTSTGRGRRLETCSKLETRREQHFFSPSCQRRMFFQSGLGLSFTPSLPCTTPSQKQGGERTNELLIAGEQRADRRGSTPSAQCSDYLFRTTRLYSSLHIG